MNPLAPGQWLSSGSKVAPELSVSQFRVGRMHPAPKKKRPSTGLNDDPLTLHKSRMAEFAHDVRVNLPKKVAELQVPNIGQRKRELLEAEVRTLESRQEEKQYLERVTPLLERYTKCLKDSQLGKGKPQLGGQHFGRVENKELKAAREAFYMEIIGYIPANEMAPTPQQLSCTTCEVPLVVAEGFDVCIQCGSIPVNSCSDYQISYRDTQDMLVKANGSYKRTARFSEWLSSIQAKENTEIPANVYDAIMKEITRERITDVNTVDITKIREYLGKMRLTRYYDHAPRILKYINGLPPITIPPDIEAKLNIMFNHIQEPFEIVKAQVAPGRSSFINYTFALYKFCELLDIIIISKQQLLKSPEKLREQEEIWEGICDMVGWVFIPTI